MTTQTRDTPSRMSHPSESTLAEAHRVALRVARSVLGEGVHDGVDAHDVAQEVLVRFAGLDPSTIANWQAWVTTAARRRALDVIRAEKRHGHAALDLFDGEDNPPGRAPLPRRLRALGASAEPVSRLALRSLATHLNDRERKVLWAHLDGWSNREIAQGLGYASADAVAVTLTRIRSKVRAAFPPGPERHLLLGETPRVY